jgi:UPF0755 protein
MKGWLLRVLTLLLVAGLLLAGFAGWRFNEFRQTPVAASEETAVFTIANGSSLRQVSRQLAERGIIDDPWLFELLARSQRDAGPIKAGEYRIEAGDTPETLLRRFREGSSIAYAFTIIEGWTFRQLREQLERDPVLVQTIDPADSDAEIMKRLAHPGEHPEGRFLPDTYHFPRGTTDLQFLERAYHAMEKTLQAEWAQRADDLPLKTPYEALILASIIEKETGAAFERPLIAAVFVQRLKKGMRLQTDPTIIYGLGAGFDGNIRYRDLKRKTPYNTYLIKGLPPTPIALPGRDAIHAALHPADSDALYFVAKGDGTHYFSKTLEEHNRAVSKYQLKGRKPKRKPEAG